MEQIGEIVERPWGTYTLLEISKVYKVKNITVAPERRLSLQLHNHRSESWVVASGVACAEVEDAKFLLMQGESTYIRSGEKHRLSNPGRIPLVLIEVQMGDLLYENDIVRFEDDYGRITKQELPSH